MPIELDTYRDKNNDRNRAKELIGVRVKIIRLLDNDIWRNNREFIEGETGTIIKDPCGFSDIVCLRMDREDYLAEKLDYQNFPREGLHLSHIEIERLDDPDGNY